MIRPNTHIAIFAAFVAFSGTVLAANSAEDAAQHAHDRYLAAINANDTVALLATVTDDIVFIAPNSPVIVGKTELEPWVRGYFDAVETTWEKTSLEFVVAGDWAFERYSYKAADLPRGGGDVSIETGNGINIYRLGSDNVWRVARDVWATDGLAAADMAIFELATCIGASGPC